MARLRLAVTTEDQGMSRITIAARDQAAEIVREWTRQDREEVPRALACGLAYGEGHLPWTAFAEEVG